MTNNKLFDWLRVYHLPVILLTALAVRMSAAFYFGNTAGGLSGAHDEITYSMLAKRYIAGYGMTFPENWYPWIQADAQQSYFSFGFSWFMAQIYKLFGPLPLIARLIFAWISTTIVLLTYLIADRLYGTRAAILSSVIATFYAYLIFYGVSLVTETPFTLMLMLSIYIALQIDEQPRWWLWPLLGVVLTLGMFMRTTIIFFIPLLFLWLLWRMPNKRDVIWLAVPATLIVVSLLPFIQRNYEMWGEFSLLEAQFGHVFWNGNHPGHEGDFHPFQVFEIPQDVLALDNDVKITNALLAMGIENIRNNPLDFVMLSLTRMREMFTFWPTADSNLVANIMRVFSFGILVPFMLVGLFKGAHKWRLLVPVYFFMLTHVGIHAVTWSMIRYRISLDPFLIIFASLPLLYLLDTLWQYVTPQKPKAITYLAQHEAH